jgi:alanine-glyoxylate transaminase/serine-glyoxylate transaminase/serine-pyruvate transaminase
MNVPPGDRTLLMIPGPTMIGSEVLAASARPVLSHSDPTFTRTVAEALAHLRQVFDTPSAQPVVVGGSGTLAMEIGLVNLIEPGDRVLILETGVFARRFKEIAQRNGAEVRLEAAPLGQPIDLDQVRRALQAFRPKVMTITHVDTSTGVRVDVPALAKLARAHEALVVVDGVCSIGGEEYHGDAWDVDLTLTASQKALGAPPGLAILSVGPRAQAAREARRAPYTGYFTDLQQWLPVMKSYEGGAPAYFGTPAITLLASIHAALEEILAEGIPQRLARHQRLARAFKVGVAALGLADVAVPGAEANTLTAVHYPHGPAAELVAAVHAEGVTISNAIHPDLRGKAFRVGHMGACGPIEVIATLAALERAMHRLGHPVDLGAGLAAAQQALAGVPAAPERVRVGV